MIVQRGHPNLHTKSRKATNDDIHLLKALRASLRQHINQLPPNSAAAIASNQIDFNSVEEKPIAAFLYNDRLHINPTYEAAGTALTLHTEGCLSHVCKDTLRAYPHRVYRHNRIWVTYYLLKGDTLKKVNKFLSGFEAQVFQHEVDHLNGKCIFHPNLLAEDSGN
jgi:peptide deformylase